MKFLKSFLLFLVNILCIPFGILTTAGCVYYTLPELTTVMNMFNIVISPTVIFWVTIASTVLYITCLILAIIFRNSLPPKFKNLFIHLRTWLMGAVGIVLAGLPFIIVNPIFSEGITVDLPRKIGIGVCLSALLLFQIFAKKVTVLVNRKLTAYETAKEVGAVGRSSVVFVNLLRLFEILFPEILLIAIVCFCVSWNMSSYFVVALVACLIPVIGNIECDINIRNKAKADKEAEQNKIAELTAQKIKGDKK